MPLQSSHHRSAWTAWRSSGLLRSAPGTSAAVSTIVTGEEPLGSLRLVAITKSPRSQSLLGSPTHFAYCCEDRGLQFFAAFVKIEKTVSIRR